MVAPLIRLAGATGNDSLPGNLVLSKDRKIRKNRDDRKEGYMAGLLFSDNGVK